MKAYLVGGPFDGQEVETGELTNEITSDGGRYVASGEFAKMKSPDDLPVSGATIPIFEFIADEDNEAI